MFSQFKDLLGDVTQQLGLDKRAEVQAIADAYGDLVEKRVLESTRVMSLRNGVLEIDVLHAPMLMELSVFQKPQILKQLRAEHPGIRDINFRASNS